MPFSNLTHNTDTVTQEIFNTLNVAGPFGPLVKKPLSLLMALDKFDSWYESAKNQPGDDFTEQVLSYLNITFNVNEADLQHIPEDGSLIIIANQPFGGIEGLILTSIIRKVRSDLKILANHFISLIPELKDQYIFMNPFKSQRSFDQNVEPFNQALNWAKEGSALAVFPAGTTSHLYLRHRSITDPRWRSTYGRLIEKAQVPVLPVYFSGSNSKTFQTLGMLHPFLRTLRMPTEVFNKQDKVLNVHIGHTIAAKQFNEYEDVRKKLAYLRRRTYNLAHRDVACENKILVHPVEAKPVAKAKPKKVLIEEFTSLPKEQLLHETDKDLVVYATAQQIPNLLHEIGRLRELTFREVEEGTGNDLDLDEYDQTYIHLIAWNKNNEDIIGSYRLGLADEILKDDGPGLYTKTLFQLKSAFLKRICPSIELGRSFVAPAYQRSFSSLFLLWRGIGEFISYRSHYRYLFGPVSISNAYSHSSQMLMLRYLKLNHHNTKFARWVKPQNPSAKPKKVLNKHSRPIGQIRELEEMISDIELEPAGIPVLIRQYLKLGAEFLAFNRDPLFSNVVDGLIVVDLHKTDPKVLNKYMGKEATKRYMDAQEKPKNKTAKTGIQSKAP